MAELRADPPDEISEWSIALAQSLVQLRLAGRLVIGHLVKHLDSRVTCYQALVALALTAGQILRPNGWAGGPIGLEGKREELGPDIGLYSTSWEARRLVVVHVTNAERLLGAAAAHDAPLVRALALAVLNSDDNGTNARFVARAMLELLAALPVDPNPGELPHE